MAEDDDEIGFPAVGKLDDPAVIATLVACKMPRSSAWLDRELAEGRVAFREALLVDEPERYQGHPAIKECVFVPASRPIVP